MTWRRYGNGRLVEVAPDRWRTASPDGVTGSAGPWYHRYASIERCTPPYIWSGRLRVLDLLTEPVWIPSEGRYSTWPTGVTWHPAHDSNDLNWNVSINPSTQRTSVWAEINGQANHTVWAERTWHDAPTLFDHEWHTWRAEVPAEGRVLFYVDDQLIASGVEHTPSMPGAVEVALRFDFMDVEFDSHQFRSEGAEPMVFDKSRKDWYPTIIHNGVRHSADRVISSNGSPRPALRKPLDTFAVHHIGAGTGQMSRNSLQVLDGIERWTAIPSNRPNMYNSASDANGVTWEYAGPFRAAHAANWNDRAWGHLALLGLDTPTPEQADGLVRGIRRAREQLVAHGLLTRSHAVVGHMDIGQTPCPGLLRSNNDLWQQIVAPLSDAVPPPAVPPPTEEESVMLVIEWKPNTAQYTAMSWDGQFLAWLWSGDASSVLLRSGARRETVSDQELRSIIESSRTTTAPPPTLPSAMAARWEARAL